MIIKNQPDINIKLLPFCNENFFGSMLICAFRKVINNE